MRTGLNCAEAAERLHDYIDDTLPGRARQGVAEHLRDCDTCREILAELRCTRRLLRSLPRDRMPTAMKTALLSAFRTPPIRPRPTQTHRSTPGSPSSREPSTEALRTAEVIRDACARAAFEAAEDAGMRGLCADGQLEAALDALRSVDLEAALRTAGRSPRQKRPGGGA